MAKQLFRKASLERLSSPEQLDKLLRVTSPMGWLATAACGVLLVGALIWGVTGRIPEKVNGVGMLMKTGGVFEVTATSTGTVKDVYFRAGDIVRRGQIMARIDQQNIVEDIKNTKAALDDLSTEKAQIMEMGSAQSRLEKASVTQQKESLQKKIESCESQVTWLKEKIAGQEELYREGLITKESLISTRHTLDTVKLSAEDAKNQIESLTLQALRFQGEKRRELTRIDQQISSTGRKLERLQNDLNEASRITSPYTGRILEVSQDEGTLVRAGQPILRLELLGKNIMNLQAVLYLPPGDGKKLKLGMKAQIAPATVEQSEHGYMLGIVTAVAEYPSTHQSMLRTLQNESLVRTIAAGGAPIAAEVDLIPAPQNPSGYKWTSSEGPRITLETGTMCMGNVTIVERRPIALVIPMLKKAVLGIGEQQGDSGAQ